MNATSRACLGALLGALLTLAIHPASRPFLLSAAIHIPSQKLESSIDHNLRQPAPPHSLSDASLWLQLACQRIALHQTLTQGEVATTLEIADRAAQLEPENAYWPQVKAVILNTVRRNDEAAEAWQRASRGSVWNDYQTQRLGEARQRLAAISGANQAWQLAYVYHERSDVPALLIERYARMLLSQTGFEKKEDIQVRYATLLNGELLRNGSRSVTLGDHGAKVVELVAYPRDLMGTSSPKRLWVGQNNLIRQMQAVGMNEETASAQNAFNNNEGWRALTPDDPMEHTNELSILSVLSATVIGACAVCAVTGTAIWGIGWAVSRRFGHLPRFSFITVVIMAGVLALATGLLTRDIWAAFVGALAGSFLLVAPNQARRTQPEDLGPLFAFLLLVLSLMCGLVIGAYGIFQTPPAVAILPQLGIPSDYYSTPLLLGLSFIFVSLGIIAVPIWALVQRLGTPHVLGLALRKLGVYLAFGSLVTGIIVGPVAVYLDRQLEQTLSEMVGNEPVYYFVHQ